MFHMNKGTSRQEEEDGWYTGLPTAATFQNHLHMQYISIQLIRYSKTCGSYPQLKAADTNNDETKQGLL
jgi:hypothetical protein